MKWKTILRENQGKCKAMFKFKLLERDKQEVVQANLKQAAAVARQRDGYPKNATLSTVNREWNDVKRHKILKQLNQLESMEPRVFQA